MVDLIARDIPGYRLLDSGAGAKLEEIAGWRVVRPCSQAIWAPRLGASDWDAAPSRCERTKTGGGRWQHRQQPPELELAWRQLRFGLRLTEFGHCGLFFEQEPLWQLFQQRLSAGARFANLFGYTGSASLAGAAVGAEVYHVDSARGVLDWGKEHQARSGLGDAALKWIHDDCRSFLALSRKRGWTYDLVFADPPSFGHGKKKETWSLESDVAGLVDDCAGVVSPGGALVVTCHTPGVQREALVNLLRPHGTVVAGELGVAHDDPDDPRILPAGIYAMIEAMPT